MLNSHFHMEMHLKCEEWPRESSTGWLLNGLLMNSFTVDALPGSRTSHSFSEVSVGHGPPFPPQRHCEIHHRKNNNGLYIRSISQQDEISEEHHPMHVNIVVCLAPHGGKDMKYEYSQIYILQYDIMGFCESLCRSLQNL